MGNLEVFQNIEALRRRSMQEHETTQRYTTTFRLLVLALNVNAKQCMHPER